MIAIREIQAAEHVDAIMALARSNWDETGFDFALKPDFDLIALLQGRGFMFVLGAFDGDHLVGYSSAMVGPHIFSTDVTTCSSNALFVSSGVRKHSVGARLIVRTEQVAAARGANLMIWNTRAGTPLARTLTRRGYTPADIVVTKGL